MLNGFALILFFAALIPTGSAQAAFRSESQATEALNNALKELQSAGSKESLDLALSELRTKATSDPLAMNVLGVVYAQGALVPKDVSVAEAYFRRSADRRDIIGLMNLFVVKHNGGDKAGACSVLEPALAWPDAGPAIDRLAECLSAGTWAPKNSQAVNQIRQKACDRGHAPSCAAYWEALETLSPAAYVKHRTQLAGIAEARNEPDMLSVVGSHLFLKGQGADVERGERMLRDAVKQKSAIACYTLAVGVVAGRTDGRGLNEVDSLLACAEQDPLSRGIALLLRGLLAGFENRPDAAQASFQGAADAGAKESAAFAEIFGYPPPTGTSVADGCGYWCKLIADAKEAIAVERKEADEEAQRQAELAAVAQQRANEEAALLAQRQNEAREAARQRRRNFWRGAFTLLGALAAGYVQVTMQIQPGHVGAYQPPSAAYATSGVASPFCVVTAAGSECRFYTLSACNSAASGLGGACTVNRTSTSAMVGSAPFCLISTAGTECRFYDVRACQVAASTVNGACATRQ